MMYIAGNIGDLSDCPHCISKPVHQVSVHYCGFRCLTQLHEGCIVQSFHN